MGDLKNIFSDLQIENEVPAFLAASCAKLLLKLTGENDNVRGTVDFKNNAPFQLENYFNRFIVFIEQSNKISEKKDSNDKTISQIELQMDILKILNEMVPLVESARRENTKEAFPLVLDSANLLNASVKSVSAKINYYSKKLGNQTYAAEVNKRAGILIEDILSSTENTYHKLLKEINK